MQIAKSVRPGSPVKTCADWPIDAEVAKRLSDKFRGLNTKDLDGFNPDYSCVLCRHTQCEFHNRPNTSCYLCEHATEENWSRYYNFD